MDFIKEKQIDLRIAKETMDEQGYCFFQGLLTEDQIKQIEENRDEMLEYYSDSFVQKRLFYKREDAGNKQGDAVMVAFENNGLPYLYPKGIISDMLKLYNSLIGNFMGIEVPRTSRSMFNSQKYYEHSRPCGDHQDGEHLEYTHTEDSYGEYVCKMEKGLLPRYVMVFVLSNENENGKGTYIRHHNSEERIDLPANAGDCFIFDNLAVRHGVPELDKARSMVGFRNFDLNPVLFQTTKPEDESDWVKVEDKLNAGWEKEITSEEAKEIMLDFNKEWKNKIFEEEKDKLAAF